MSSKYPILDNKPIDQWKVTELKEELKRRRLLVKGLKDELIRRLDDALRTERVNEGKDVITGDDLVADQPEDEAQFVGDKPGDEAKSVNAQPEGQAQISEAPLVATEAAGNTDAEVECADDAKVQDKAFDSVQVSSKEFSEGVAEQAIGSSGLKDDLPDNYPTLFSENVAPKVTLGNKDAEVTEKLVLNGDSENRTLKPELDHLESQVENEGSNQKPQLEKEAMRSPSDHVMVDSSTPNNQVSEVSPTFGFQVKSDSISTDSMSLNEKIEVKDNIISDNVNLELDNVKPEMVEPSTANHVPVVGESNTMDVEEQEEKVASVEVKDDINTSNADLSKKNDIIDLGYSEKLNLDRSSGDDSMDEDLESKQIDSKYNSDDMGDKTEKHDKHAVNSDDLGYSTANHISTDENEMHVENQTRPSVPSEKRKLNDQEAVGSTEPVKRQRKWASESLKVTEQQSSPTPKNILTPTVSRGSFSRSDSTVGNEDSPKERVVPPSEKPPTNSLRIDRFLRPFTLKAVQELLGKTGTVTSFWMDHIKTHCYVSYSSVEEAIETRNAVYNIQWPANGGRLLVAEFVDPQEVKNKLEAPQSPAAPITPTAPAVPHQPSPRQQVPRQQLPPPPALPPPPPLSNPPPARERLTNLPPPPPPPERQDPPIVTLDDLFRKTKATPRIYYLPLTEEQVAAKLERAKNTK